MSSYAMRLVGFCTKLGFHEKIFSEEAPPEMSTSMNNDKDEMMKKAIAMSLQEQ